MGIILPAMIAMNLSDLSEWSGKLQPLVQVNIQQLVSKKVTKAACNTKLI